MFSIISNKKDYYTLLTYQKYCEGEDYRVDYVELVNVSKDGNQLDRIRLAAKDNETITYEVNSILNGNVLTKEKSISTFSNEESLVETIQPKKYQLKLFREKRIDTIDLNEKFELIGN